MPRTVLSVAIESPSAGIPSQAVASSSAAVHSMLATSVASQAAAEVLLLSKISSVSVFVKTKDNADIHAARQLSSSSSPTGGVSPSQGNYR